MADPQNQDRIDEIKSTLKRKIFWALFVVCAPVFFIAQVVFVDAMLALVIWFGSVVFLSMISAIAINVMHGMAEGRRNDRQD